MRDNQINWNLLEEIYILSKKKGVGFSLNYEESSDQWYGEVISAAPLECFVGKSRGYDTAMSSLKNWLGSL